MNKYWVIFNPFIKSNRIALYKTLLPVAILTVLVYINIWSYTENQQIRSRALTLERLSNKRALLESKLNQLLSATQALIAYAKANDGVDETFFIELSKQLTYNNPIFKNITLAPNNIVAFVYPLKDNESVIGFDYMKHPLQRIEVQRAMDQRSTIITGPLELLQGGKAFIVRSPIFLNNPKNSSEIIYWGMISMVVDYQSLIREIGLRTSDTDFEYAIRSISPNRKENTVFYGDSLIMQNNPEVLKINLPGGDTWDFASIPTSGWKQSSEIPAIMILVSTFIILAFGIMVFVTLINYMQLKILYNEKEQLVDQIRNANKAQQKIFSIIAHDLKAPFNALVMNIELLALTDEVSSDQIKEKIPELRQYAYSLNMLATNLLYWAGSNIGEIKYSPNYYNFNDIVSEVLELIAPVAKKKQIEIATSITGSQSTYCDKNMILTVLRNLISNGIKFTLEGGYIKIESRNAADFLHIDIIDSGIGISKDAISKLFTHGQADSSYGTEGEPGTGLGLMLSKEFIELHGGDMWVTSEPGKGSCFSFSLPTTEKNSPLA